MKKRSFITLGLLFLLGLVSCETLDKKKVSPTVLLADSVYDSHSYANIHQVRTKHLHLDLDINFENKTIYGIARHEILNTGADTAIFDIKALDIQKVTLGKGKELETNFMIGQWDKDSILGQPLLVQIQPDTKYINIYYETTDKTEAVEWLDPQLTAGKKHPYLYTQGQAILTRSWIPVQDAPANRITYSADVRVPVDLMAVMSATNPQVKMNDGRYSFRMDQPVTCYLIALAVGNLKYKKLGKNCGVYTEPEMIEKSAYEFADLPKMIDAASKLYGAYQWKQYDLLVLPYSFPFGGMENPRLTFVSPTIIAGDRSLVSVVAHELAHSWSGNLVTNSSWNDFWLNEGFTVYFENRIMENLFGKDIADMLISIEFQELQDEIRLIEVSRHPEDSKLKLELSGRNPDDGMTDIAYVKGAFFLKTLERKVGREKMDDFLNAYFKKFAFKTISTEEFEAYLKQELLKPNEIKFNTQEWLYEEGIPTNCARVYSKRFYQIERLADRLIAGENIFKKRVKWIKIKGRKRRKKQIEQLIRDQYLAQEWQAFIRRLPKKTDPETLALIDRNLRFKSWGNAEVATEWYLLGLRSNYSDIKPTLEKFLMKIGRRKYLAPLYEELAKTPKNKAWAKQIFEKAKDNYHYVSRSSIEEILGR